MNINDIEVMQYVGLDVIDIWDEVKSLVELGLSPSYNEQTVDDVFHAIINKHSQLLVAFEQGEPIAAIVTSFRQHPQYKVVFIEAMAGKGLMKLIKEYWSTFCTWAAMNNAVVIEGCTQPPMTRLLKRVGMQKVYDVVRCSLEVPNVRS